MSISKVEKSLFFNINKILNRLDQIEKKIDDLEEKMENSLAIQRCHIMRVKNNEELSDQYILEGHKYSDISPDKAYRIYQQKDADFILLDVSAKDYNPVVEMSEAIHIPLEELNIRYREITNKATTILVISEDGTKSVRACELLNEHGYYNVNNISGGYKFWPEFRLKEVPSHQESA